MNGGLRGAAEKIFGGHPKNENPFADFAKATRGSPSEKSTQLNARPGVFRSTASKARATFCAVIRSVIRSDPDLEKVASGIGIWTGLAAGVLLTWWLGL